MPVKIKQKQTKKTEWVSYHDYCHNINHELYEKIEIKGLYELYNSISGKELWQATLEKEEAFGALELHPNLFRIEYSDRNTKPEPKKRTLNSKVIYEINANDIAIMQGQRLNQLRDAGLLDSNLRKAMPQTPHKAPQITKSQNGIWMLKKADNILSWIVTNTFKFIFYVLIGIAIWYFTIYKPIFN